MRGSLVTVAMNADYGKPRPALVMQADTFGDHPTVTLLPITGTLTDAPLLRATLQPTPENGLQKPSQVMIDKTMTVKREKLGPAFGQLDHRQMLEVERCLIVFLGIG